jgi:hypothetical protein
MFLLFHLQEIICITPPLSVLTDYYTLNRCLALLNTERDLMEKHQANRFSKVKLSK